MLAFATLSRPDMVGDFDQAIAATPQVISTILMKQVVPIRRLPTRPGKHQPPMFLMPRGAIGTERGLAARAVLEFAVLASGPACPGRASIVDHRAWSS